MKIPDLPIHAGAADTEGLNHVLGAVVHDAQAAKDFAELLEQNPRGVIRRTVLLNKYQNAALMEMTDQEVKALVEPVIKGLRGPNALKMRINMVEKCTTHSPLKIHTVIDIEY